MLRIKTEITSIFYVAQRWYNYILTLFQGGLNVSKSYMETNRASDNKVFVNR